MKKTLLSIITLSTACAFSQNVVFNDLALKQKIVLHGQSAVGAVTGTNISIIDTDNNGEISITEAQAYTGRLYLNQNGSDFYADLTGIEEFINITELFCENNQMLTLDVSSNTALTGLYCENNQISSLNLTNNTNLEILNYRYNNLSSINLSANVNLTNITCTNNGIVNLDLTNNVNLVYLNCVNNSITSLNLSNQPNLSTLYCNDNAISSISLNSPLNLDEFVCNNNNIAALNLNGYTNLTYLVCSENDIPTLDLSTNISLESFEANNCELTAVTLPTTSNLESISVTNNLLTTLDITSSTDIFTVLAADNSLTTIDLSNNPNLFEVDLSNNSIDSLDFTVANLYLYNVNCENNELTFLDIANGNNNNINNFSTIGNSNLSCIQVDIEAYSTTNWTSIDATTSFSIDCPTLVSSITVEGENSVSEISTDDGTLQMEATVLSALATDNTVTWSVTNGSGAATIDNNGLLTATNNGTVTVKATANDASGVSNTAVITISNQTMLSIQDNSIELDLTIYPNPTNGTLNIATSHKVELIEVYNITGEKVFQTNQIKFDVSHLESGIYSIRIVTEKSTTTKQVIVK